VTTTVSRAAILLALLAAAGCGPHAISTPASTATPTPFATGDFPEYGYAPDLSWLAGRIGIAMRGSMCTYVIFATHAGVPWGGKFSLHGAPGMLDGLRAGDTVVVHGTVAKHPARDCGAAEFDVVSVELH
jgi:hypothetical protein